VSSYKRLEPNKAVWWHGSLSLIWLSVWEGAFFPVPLSTMLESDTLSLPLPLLLLVHLQILEYPHRNKPEYDHQVFDPSVRGLRDRTKTMEDVCYFLVGKIERKDAKVVRVHTAFTSMRLCFTASIGLSDIPVSTAI
jgi:hypothetical protein